MATSRLRALLKAASPGWSQNGDHIDDADGIEIFENSTNTDRREANARLAALAPALALLVLDMGEALERRVSEQSGHFLNCPAHDEIVQWGEAKVGSCACADDLAILARLAELEAELPEVPHG